MDAIRAGFYLKIAAFRGFLKCHSSLFLVLRSLVLRLLIDLRANENIFF